MRIFLVSVAVLGPILFGIAALAVRCARARTAVALASAGVTALAGVLMAAQGSFTLGGCAALSAVGRILEFLLAAAVIVIGWRIRSPLVGGLGAAQLGLVVLEGAAGAHAAKPPTLFVADPLSITLVLIISLVGALIVVYATGYMSVHAHHAPETASRPGMFFFFLIAFLGFMNGLVLADDTRWLSIFWEATTLCSFFLIRHDGTRESCRNAENALVLNAFGGILLTAAACLQRLYTGQETLQGMLEHPVLLPVALVLVATFIKSAQLPFQSWLLGAMVAPTPVSALLHSSTMVKAGSYLALRLIPAYQGTALAPVVALAGAFTFATASALAISQSNAKRVLAYSTIANLGLILACAGVNSPLAHAAAVIVLVFHAVSKGLLFLCVGSIEQNIGSREIEDMSGIPSKMPLTTAIAITGMFSMVVPPFGMLIGKWMAIEASVRAPGVLLFLVIGSAATVFFWSKWIGRIITTSSLERAELEKIPRSMAAAQIAIVAAVLASAFAAMPVYRLWVKPVMFDAFAAARVPAHAVPPPTSVDAFMQWPFLTILCVVVVAVVISLGAFRRSQLRLPFLCGENAGDADTTYAFVSLMDQRQQALVTSYYLAPIFGERTLTKWVNLLAVFLILTLVVSAGVP